MHFRFELAQLSNDWEESETALSDFYVKKSPQLVDAFTFYLTELAKYNQMY